MTRHSVIFRFKSTISEAEKQSFFDATQSLSQISGVQNLEVVKQTSPKNDFEFGILMAFDNADIYQKYNTDPNHQVFIQNYWIPSVDSFLEIDYEALSKN